MCQCVGFSGSTWGYRGEKNHTRNFTSLSELPRNAMFVGHCEDLIVSRYHNLCVKKLVFYSKIMTNELYSSYHGKS